MKKVFRTIGILVAAILFIAVAINNFYTDLIDPYLWHKSIVNRWQDEGWKIVSTREQPSMLFPWTLVWRPLGMVVFVRDDMVSAVYRTDGKPGALVTAVVARFIRDERGRIDASRNIEAYNCSTRQFAVMGDVETKKKFDIVASDGSPLPGKWYPIPDDLAAYFCKRSAPS